MSTVKKAPRRTERIFAFKVLYGTCFTPANTETALERAFRLSPDRPETLSDALEGFAWELTLGVWKNRNALDAVIGSFSQNWRVERMGKVDLTLLRVAMYELSYTVNVPPKVVINEAIELSKLFGDDKSRSFINGILDAAAKALEAGTLKKVPQTDT